jgi:hypothetical protein
MEMDGEFGEAYVLDTAIIFNLLNNYNNCFN